MNQRRIMCSLLTVLAFFLAGAGLYLLLQPAPQAEVAKHIGQVTLSNDAQPEGFLVYDGLPVVEGDRITTGKAAMAYIDINQNQLVEIAEQTTATFKELVESAGSTRIFLEFGTLINEVKARLTDDQVYTITTPNTTVSVRGTFFMISTYLDPVTGLPVTEVSVYEGDVDVFYYDNENKLQSLTVSAGNHCKVKAQQIERNEMVRYDHLSADQLLRLCTLMEERSASADAINAVRSALDDTPSERVISGPQLPDRAAADEQLQPYHQLLEQNEAEQAQQEIPAQIMLPDVQPVHFASYPNKELVVKNLEEMEKVCAYVEATAKDFSQSQLSEVEYAKALAVYERVQSIKKAQRVISTINDLPQPESIVLSDEKLVRFARAQTNSLNAESGAYLPQESLDKLSDCETSLALSQKAAKQLDYLKEQQESLTIAQILEAQSAYQQLNVAQKEALGIERREQIQSLQESITQNIRYSPTAGTPETENFVAVVANMNDLDITSLSMRDTITIRVSAEPISAPETMHEPLATCYEIKLVSDDGTVIQPKAGHTVTVDVQIPQSAYHEEGYLVWHYHDHGKIEAISNVRQIRDGDRIYLRFTTDSFSRFLVTKADTGYQTKKTSNVTVTQSSIKQQMSHLPAAARQRWAVILLGSGVIALMAAFIIGYRKPKDAVDSKE